MSEHDMDTPEHPLLMSSPLVRQVLEGRKTQTRRLVSPRGWSVRHADHVINPHLLPELGPQVEFRRAGGTLGFLACPYGVRGHRLWVRESYAPRYFDGGRHAYRADWDGRAADVVREPRWTPGIHMPRAACRLVLVAVDVSVQRLQDITDEDALAEGVEPNPVQPGTWMNYPPRSSAAGWASPRESFRTLWDSINAGRGAWEANPWVWRVAFRRAT